VPGAHQLAGGGVLGGSANEADLLAVAAPISLREADLAGCLGREGPSVQMGETIAELIGRIFRRNGQDRRALIAAGAGAWLATAVNAPGAGAIFVLEELVGRVEPRIGVPALGASGAAIFVSREMLGPRRILPSESSLRGASWPTCCF
jgi:H+/Cl- antiporter ClcA